MDKIKELYEKRDAASKELIRRAFEFQEPKEVPFVFNTANYFSFGYSPEELPEDYYTDPAAMYKRQIGQFENQLSLIEDDGDEFAGLPGIDGGIVCHDRPTGPTCIWPRP